MSLTSRRQAAASDMSDSCKVPGIGTPRRFSRPRDRCALPDVEKKRKNDDVDDDNDNGKVKNVFFCCFYREINEFLFVGQGV